MPMRHTSRSSLRRGPGVLSMDMLGGGRAIGGLSHMLGEGAGQPRPRLAQSKRKLACTLLARAPQPSPKPTRESTLLTHPARETSGCSDAPSEQLGVVWSRGSCCSSGEGERRRLPGDGPLRNARVAADKCEKETFTHNCMKVTPCFPDRPSALATPPSPLLLTRAPTYPSQ